MAVTQRLTFITLGEDSDRRIIGRRNGLNVKNWATFKVWR